MKTKNFMLTALALVVAITVSATKIPTLNVIPVENQKALVAFENSHPSDVELSIRNKSGEVLYYKKSQAPVENMRMVFNFMELKDGVYNVCLEVNNCKISREITVSEHQLKQVGAQVRAFSPYCTLEDNLLKVSFLNNAQKNVYMTIYNEGKYVAGRKLGREMCIQKAFDFSKLESGQYEIVFNGNNEEYIFSVNK